MLTAITRAANLTRNARERAFLHSRAHSCTTPESLKRP